MVTAGEGAQVEALEADFLQDLYKVRQLKAETSRAVHKVGHCGVAVVPENVPCLVQQAANMI